MTPRGATDQYNLDAIVLPSAAIASVFHSLSSLLQDVIAIVHADCHFCPVLLLSVLHVTNF
jgi:hypothetical protein